MFNWMFKTVPADIADRERTIAERERKLKKREAEFEKYMEDFQRERYGYTLWNQFGHRHPSTAQIDAEYAYLAKARQQFEEYRAAEVQKEMSKIFGGKLV